jgi:hypothetical protein
MENDNWDEFLIHIASELFTALTWDEQDVMLDDPRIVIDGIDEYHPWSTASYGMSLG